MKRKNILIIIGNIIIIVIIIFLINLYPRNGTMICTYNNENDLMKINSTYIITFKNRYVTKLETKEILESNDNEMLEEYKISLETIYSKYQNLKYYKNSIKLEENRLTTITKINYNKINIQEFISIDKENENLIKDNKISFNKLKKQYKNNGARCIYN